MKTSWNWTLKSYINNWGQYLSVYNELYNDRVMRFWEKALVLLILIAYLPLVTIGGQPE